MDKLFSLIIIVFILSFNSVVYSAKNESGNQGTGQLNQVQNQNQVQTENQGEETQLKVNTQEKENMSAVSQKVEELLTTEATKEGGIGEQVRQIAQEQKQAQTKIQTELGRVASRSGFLKSLIGPNYQALKNMQKTMEQNQLRIQQLEQLKSQITNLGDVTQITAMIQVLTEQNTALQDQISLEEKSGSLFGWFFKLLAK